MYGSKHGYEHVSDAGPSRLPETTATEPSSMSEAGGSHAPQQATTSSPGFLQKARNRFQFTQSKDDPYATRFTYSNSSSETSLPYGDSKNPTDSDHEARNDLTDLYAPIQTWEGMHRYDPKAVWEEEEERRLIRRLDYKICAYVCFMFFALQLDRGNISQALSDNMLDDLGLTTDNYNYGQTIFFVSFLLAELPSQLISKKLGPDNWIPIQMVSWSIVACSQCRLTGRSTFYLTRCLLGVIEGGFIPDVILYLSYFYKSKELPIRLSFFWGAYMLTFIISAFLATGILRLRGHGGWAGWRWLFALEGGLTALIGVFSWFYLPPSPTQTASRFRGKNGWFSEREEIIMVNRIIRDDPGKGDMHNRQAVTPKLLWKALKDYDMWPIYLLGLTWTIPHQPIQAYITLILRGLNFNVVQTNLLTVPAYFLFMLQLIFWTWLSEKINNRFIIILVCQIWCLPLVLALELLPIHASPWARYAISALLIGFPYIHAILVAITSRNAGSVRTRTVGSALYNMFVQTSNIISSNIYRNDDKPLYRRGNKVILGLIAWNIVLIVSIKFYYMWRNSSRERVWSRMTSAEKAEYLRTTKDEGNKRLDFRFAH